jgi:protein arginine N-methyltransferase 1
MKKRQKKPSLRIKQKAQRRPYSTPALIEYGAVRDFTHALTGMCGLDGGSGLVHIRTMACISPAPFVEEHRHLLGDQRLQEIYRRAIFAAVRPGDVVLDLGTGSGLHAFFAAQAGAKKVYAIESEGIVAIARAAAKRNGFAEKIEFIYGNSFSVDLPEKVDVIISNIGYLSSLQFLPDAAKRFLKPGGRMLPNAVHNSFVPVRAPDFYKSRVEFWKEKRYGFDFSDFHSFAVNRAHANHCKEKNFLAAPAALGAIDLTGPLRGKYDWKREFTASRAGTIYGLLGWYSFHLGQGIEFSTKPPLLLSPAVWTQPFLPCREPFTVRKGETVRVRMEMYTKGSYEEPIWNWEMSAGKLRQKQSSFQAIALSPEILGKL